MQEHESRVPVTIERSENMAGEYGGRLAAVAVLQRREVDNGVGWLSCRGASAAEQDEPNHVCNRRAVPARTFGCSVSPGLRREPIDIGAQAQAATARRAITLTRCARYSALAWMSELSPSSLMAISLIASGVKDFASAASISGTRKTLGPAPVTATRTPAGVLATNTPTMA